MYTCMVEWTATAARTMVPGGIMTRITTAKKHKKHKKKKKYKYKYEKHHKTCRSHDHHDD